jgi:hypothetical protein
MNKSRRTVIRKVSYKEILNKSKEHIDLIDGYKNLVLSQRTRTIRLLGRKSSSKIIHTLLGYEVKTSYKRIQCPDLVTARYLRLFSEIGCHSIKLPYDPTLTAQIIPEFESAIEGIIQNILEHFPNKSITQRHAIRIIYGIIRKQLIG